jgi:hypothetical protein
VLRIPRSMRKPNILVHLLTTRNEANGVMTGLQAVE